MANKFNKGRGMEKVEAPDKDPEAYKHHKRKLSSSFSSLILDRESRLRSKTIDLESIEVIEIKFLIPFSDGAIFNTRTRFLREYGLSPVLFKDFNRTVLFAIANQEKFGIFHSQLNQYVESSNKVSPSGRVYAIMTTIYDIKYHTSSDIINYCAGELVFELINNNQFIDSAYDRQKHALVEQLQELKRQGAIRDYDFDPYGKMVQIKQGSKDALNILASNFDILARAHSLRTPKIRPDNYNEARLTWDLIIRATPGATTIGIIDNGIRPIDPLQEVLSSGGMDITQTGNALSATHKHGTIVGSLAAVGENFFSGNNELIADANIYSIKVLEDIEGYIDVLGVVNSIREAVGVGIRIFNLSVCAQGKSYNEAPSFLAYQLDKLAYELDILIFIAAGNMTYEDVAEMQKHQHPVHEYPYHYYSPGESTDFHNCEGTNICIPAESMNNITVGSIAENYREDTVSDLSLDKALPAYYSRKNHYDFTQRINGGLLSINHGNINFFKPDIAMPGGDLLNQDSAMQVIGFGEMGNDFYTFDSGTSLSTPLAANLAAKLLNLYPNLTPQSVKALLINSAQASPFIPAFSELIRRRKETLSQEEFGLSFSALKRSEKSKVTKKIISKEVIHRNLMGYGRPNVENLLYSNPDSVSLIIEDSIRADHHKVIPINIPEYLLEGEGSDRLYIRATLCFKINPAWGNHVDYNPLHMSFNFANSFIKNSPQEVSEIIADRDHTYYDRLYQVAEILALQAKKNRDEIDESESKKLSNLKLKAKNEHMGIKKKLESWSEDFYPLVNKPLSNRQQISILIKKEEILKVNNQIVLVMRCAIKENLDIDIQGWADTTKEHPFSLALRVEDRSKLGESNLYEALKACNTIEIVTNNIVSVDQNVELDNE